MSTPTASSSASSASPATSTAPAGNRRSGHARPQLLDASGQPVASPPAASTDGNREAPRPIDEVRFGRVKAAIWQNSVETQDGTFVRYGVTFERLFVNRDGRWAGTGSFGKDDLLLLSKVASAAFDRIHELQMERPL